MPSFFSRFKTNKTLPAQVTPPTRAQREMLAQKEVSHDRHWELLRKEAEHFQGLEGKLNSLTHNPWDIPNKIAEIRAVIKEAYLHEDATAASLDFALKKSVEAEKKMTESKKEPLIRKFGGPKKGTTGRCIETAAEITMGSTNAMKMVSVLRDHPKIVGDINGGITYAGTLDTLRASAPHLMRGEQHNPAREKFEEDRSRRKQFQYDTNKIKYDPRRELKAQEKYIERSQRDAAKLSRLEKNVQTWGGTRKGPDSVGPAMELQAHEQATVSSSDLPSAIRRGPKEQLAATSSPNLSDSYWRKQAEDKSSTAGPSRKEVAVVKSTLRP